MQLKEFLSYNVETVQPNDTLQQAAEKMKELDVGSMPVCEGSHLVGMLTDRDITIRATAKGYDPTKTMVREVMTPDVLYCFENQEVDEAAKIMQENQIRRLFVLNADNELVGITSLGELATASGDRLLAGETLERVSDPTEPGKSELSEQHQGEMADEAEGLEGEISDDLPCETRVTGLFHDRQAAKKAIKELKDAGFNRDLIAIAIPDGAEDKGLIEETAVQAASGKVSHIPSGLSSEDVLVLVEAEHRASEALEILNRNNAVTGGVRIAE